MATAPELTEVQELAQEATRAVKRAQQADREAAVALARLRDALMDLGIELVLDDEEGDTQ